jgi:hypothetical protein
MAIAININEQVRVKLTDYGREVEQKYLRTLFAGSMTRLSAQERERFVRDCTREADVLGYSKWQLWELMQVFGSELFNGQPKQLFEKNDLYIGDTW